MILHNKAHNKAQGQFRTPRASVRALFTNGLMTGLAMGLIAIGSILLAFSCAPATPAVNGGGTTDPVASAPGAPTRLVVNTESVGGASFTVQWSAPETIGTKPDGTALEPSEIGYRVYYLAETTDQTTEPNAKSIIESGTQVQVQVGSELQVTITELLPDTRYFVIITSYNTLAPQLGETASNVIEGSTINESSAPGAPTVLVLNAESVGGASFTVQWSAPETIGTKPDGTALDPSEIGYRVYYLAETADDTVPAPNAESIRKSGTQVQVPVQVGSELQATITGLLSDTRYFVIITSYNTLAPQLEETASNVSTVATAADFEGSPLSYAKESYEFTVGVTSAIELSLTGTPTIPSGDSSASIVYSFTRIEGENFDDVMTIESSTGDIMITITPTNAGEATYTVQASADGYNTQEVTLTFTVKKADFGGLLSYSDSVFVVGSENTISPKTKPTVYEVSGDIIRYALTRTSETGLDPPPAIIDTTGVITIGSIDTIGTATYTVQASATGYNTPEAVSLTITIVNNTNKGMLEVSTYYSSEMTDILPVMLGQAIADSGTFAMQDIDAILTLSNLMDGESYTIHFGTVVDGTSYSGTRSKQANDSTITISKQDLTMDTSNSFSFEDGAVIGISGLGITDTQHVATYLPSNIYNHQDLQAMRKDLTRDYLLRQNIEFPSPTGTSTSNYEAVGSEGEGNRFTGSINGADYAITGIEIVGTDNYQGLFGAMEGSSVDVVIASNLVLNDFKIVGGAYVGALTGRMRMGTVDRVRVEVSNASSPGRVEANGGVILGQSFSTANGGGLIGHAGLGGSDIHIRIRNTRSAIAVSGTGTGSNVIGGLLGIVDSGVELIDSHATGAVTGVSAVGGLVGANMGTVSGSYATGSVTGSGSNWVGGLVGSNMGIVSGSYATGDVTGTTDVGGLVGVNMGTVTGYATGDVTGNGNTGGLIGQSDKGVTGYARGIVRRSSGTSPTFGKTIGSVPVGGGAKTYSSADSSGSESQLYDGETGTTVLTVTNGRDGTSVTVDDTTTEATFSEFDFGTELGQWTWFAGKWPAINIGVSKPANEQPLDP